MDKFTEHMIKKGWVKLQPGSYRTWMSKRWHEMFERRGLVRKNLYQQFVANTGSLPEFIKWLDLYDKAQHDRDFPKSNKFLTEEESREIRQMI